MFSLPAVQEFSTLTLLSAGASVLLGLLYLTLFPGKYQFPPGAPKLVSGQYPIIGASGFFTARWDFFRNAIAQSPTGNFSFFLGKYPVVGLSGEIGRRVFFDSRELGFAEGYAVLFGQSPNSLHDNQDFEKSKELTGPGGFSSRTYTRMLKAENFVKSLPQLRKDVQGSMNRLANDPSGITDPFESIYRIVYQLTIRTVGCDDIAENPELLEKTLQLFETVEASATATTILFPKFPSIGIIKRTIAGGRLYMIIMKIVNERRKTGKRRDDPLQMLIDDDVEVEQIVTHIIGSLFAGLLNSGINSAWALAYLATNPEWMGRVRDEINFVAQKYTSNPDAPLVEQLSEIPSDAWESEFPMMHLCLRDSIRLQLLGTAFRRNISGRDVPVGDHEVIPPGAFVCFHVGDIHLNPDIYPEPTKWDPSRYLPDRAEDKKVHYGWMGWGLGRHPCLGMRFAKLEQNMITAYFIATFDYELTDKDGQKVHDTPPVNFNSHTAEKPHQRVYLKYKKR